MSKNKQTIMLSLDTSTADSGVAVWINGELKEYFALTKPKKALKGNIWMTEQFYDLFKKYKPDIVILESMAVVKNMKTMNELVTLIGRAEGFCYANDIFCDSLSPPVWRKLVADENEKIPIIRVDTKPWAIQKVKQLFGIDEKNDNICEAILIGQAYINLVQKKGIAI